MHRLRVRLAVLLCTQLLWTPGFAQTPQGHQADLDSFEQVWTTIRDKHWEKNPGGLNWDAIHAEFRPKVERAKNIDEVRGLLKEMLSRLHQTHFGILPATAYEAVGDLEAANSGTLGSGTLGSGTAGIDLRILDGHAVVTEVDPGSSAEHAGVKPGWEIEIAKGVNLQAAAQALAADSSIPELLSTRAVEARITGPIGGKLPVTFLDKADTEIKLDLALTPPRGELASFGNLPATPVWFESKQIAASGAGAGPVGYVHFNYFLDLQHVMENFGSAVKACGKCGGMIIDLRGNPGGIGAMAMGMAGFFVDMQGLRLGTMYMRDAQLNFAVNPRFPNFAGPLAILVDACSASTSEIFAGGLQDLHRARVFGTRSAAAALPSVIERLPNGDGFQYAVGNYISTGGKPLEGEGVKPDVEVRLTRTGLLAGHDAAVDAALEWIRKAGK